MRERRGRGEDGDIPCAAGIYGKADKGRGGREGEGGAGGLDRAVLGGRDGLWAVQDEEEDSGWVGDDVEYVEGGGGGGGGDGICEKRGGRGRRRRDRGSHGEQPTRDEARWESGGSHVLDARTNTPASSGNSPCRHSPPPLVIICAYIRYYSKHPTILVPRTTATALPNSQPTPEIGHVAVTAPNASARRRSGSPIHQRRT